MSISTDERMNPSVNGGWSINNCTESQISTDSYQILARQHSKALFSDDCRQINFKSDIDLEMEAIFDNIPSKKKSITKNPMKNSSSKKRMVLDESIHNNLNNMPHSSIISSTEKIPELENSNSYSPTKDSALDLNQEIIK